MQTLIIIPSEMEEIVKPSLSSQEEKKVCWLKKTEGYTNPKNITMPICEEEETQVGSRFSTQQVNLRNSFVLYFSLKNPLQISRLEVPSLTMIFTVLDSFHSVISVYFTEKKFSKLLIYLQFKA